MAGLLTRLKHLKKRFDQINEIAYKIDQLQKAVGHFESRLTRQELTSTPCLWDFEFKVYSQWGEDGIIQYLTKRMDIPTKVFVEFGVYDYRESNTRFLLQNDNWSGLIIDSSARFIDQIKKDELYFRNDLRAACAFVTRENINDLLSTNGIAGDIGLLSIDIDGNDYWIWESISVITPRIVICEYDSLLGPVHEVATPYSPDFDRAKAHYSNLYGGASIAALDSLARRKGYSLVGSNSAGNNAFFVRSDVVGNIAVFTPQQAYVKSKFRNSKDKDGNQTYLGFEESRSLIGEMPVFNFSGNKLIKMKELF
ncbi:MAG: hypothetical protein HY961_09435 [Ignavibacteriae bacterium]|nr:hypothetical protein [Ignavibacteriota bacterium]